MFLARNSLHVLCKNCSQLIRHETCKNGITLTSTPSRMFVASWWASFKKRYKEKHRDGSREFVNKERDLKERFDGVDLAVAKHLIRGRASVQFANGQWFGMKEKDYHANRITLGSLKVISVNAEDTNFDMRGVQQILRLKKLTHLSFERCPFIDDHCIASLVALRDSLTHLNISGCPRITENGLATLHKLRKLQRLNMSDLPAVSDSLFIALMLEDLRPSLKIDIVSKKMRVFSKEEVKKYSQDVEHEDYDLDRLCDR